ncbi:hypothetical protein ACQR1I_16665 [Bradyrhizobium sp. HKCCYLS2038]|uniref:hypothetical protein n=1 Tax=unclassified Bradyrhizobium TaxID=2631580 RepID=UPI003EB98F07
MSEVDETPEAIADRLRMLRMLISGTSQPAFAARLGIETRRWNNFERGLPLSKEVAIRIVKTFPDITLDWLFLGRTDSLTLKRQRELEELSSQLPEGPASQRSRA